MKGGDKLRGLPEQYEEIYKVRKDYGREYYYITSLPLDSDRITSIIRNHWSIENNLHWQLDVSFNEDNQNKKEKCSTELFCTK